MPQKAFVVCCFPRCNKLTRDRVCEDHRVEYELKRQKEKAKRSKRYDDSRESSTKRGYNHRWRKARETYLKRNPLCLHCKDNGELIKAEVVDHITPHKGDSSLFWDRDNWQPLCHRCHNTKTAKQDGGFGR